MKAIGVIPARLESTRLPGKALKDVAGLPAIVHVYRRCTYCKTLDEVYVATDSTEIERAVVEHGGKVIRTGPHCNGSERIAEAIERVECDIVVNVQGDEILVQPDHIDQIVSPLFVDDTVDFSLGVTPFGKTQSLSDFKAVLDLTGNMMYCSRADIPHSLSGAPSNLLKVVFVVGFRRDSLKRFVAWPQTKAELTEPNEFLRILEHGEKIRAVLVDNAKISLDTAADLAEIRQLIKTDSMFAEYR